jgi:hypothetical protein
VEVAVGKGRSLVLAGLAALALLGAMAFWVLRMAAGIGTLSGAPAPRPPCSKAVLPATRSPT